MIPPNKSPEPTAVGAGRSAIAVHLASRRWLSFLRYRRRGRRVNSIARQQPAATGNHRSQAPWAAHSLLV